MLCPSGSLDCQSTPFDSQYCGLVADPCVRPRHVNPNLARNRGQRESQPERNPEELLRRKSVNSEECADDGSCRGYAESDGERTKHPLAVLSNLTRPDVP